MLHGLLLVHTDGFLLSNQGCVAGVAQDAVFVLLNFVEETQLAIFRKAFVLEVADALFRQIALLANRALLRRLHLQTVLLYDLDTLPVGICIIPKGTECALPLGSIADAILDLALGRNALSILPDEPGDTEKTLVRLMIAGSTQEVVVGTRLGEQEQKHQGKHI